MKTPINKNTKQELEEAHSLKIERLACSGGGAKGVVYPGAYTALTKTGVRAGIQAISGTSAGSITAALMSVGMEPSTLRQVLSEKNLQSLLGERVGKFFEKNKPGVSFISKDGKPMIDFVRDNLINAVKEGLKKEALPNPLPKDLNDLITKMDYVNNKSFTFGDLAVLHKYFPQRFKKLIIPAVGHPSGELQIFNEELTPNVEIALACRASASIPIIFEPIQINVNGELRSFVDGGMYDNLPTEYFDSNPDGTFFPNTKPAQTLVLAFAKNTEDKKQGLFKALYGPRWDEIVTIEMLEEIMRLTLKETKMALENEPTSLKEQQVVFMHALRSILNNKVQEKTLPEREAEVILKTTHELLLNIEKDPQKYKKLKEDKGAPTAAWLSELVKEKITPTLLKASAVEKFKRNELVKILGDLSLDYTNTQRIEENHHKLRSKYALRVVELQTGELTSLDFKKATTWFREMDALGYLDTINHITNHQLEDKKVFNAEKFYEDLVQEFRVIYKATIIASGKNPSQDLLIQRLSSLETKLRALKKEDGTPLTSEADIQRQLYQEIRDAVQKKGPNSLPGFALSRAVEHYNKVITDDRLYKELYEKGFKNSGTFARSTISGRTVFTSASLHQALKNKSMLELSKNAKPDSRSYKLFNELKNLKGFDSLREEKLPTPESPTTSYKN